MQAISEPPSRDFGAQPDITITSVIFHRVGEVIRLPLRDLSERELAFLKLIVRQRQHEPKILIEVVQHSDCDRLAHDYFTEREWATRLFLFKFASAELLEIEFTSS